MRAIYAVGSYDVARRRCNSSTTFKGKQPLQYYLTFMSCDTIHSFGWPINFTRIIQLQNTYLFLFRATDNRLRVIHTWLLFRDIAPCHVCLVLSLFVVASKYALNLDSNIF